MNSSYKARAVADFSISYKCAKKPKRVVLMPDREDVSFTYEDGSVIFNAENMKIYSMYEIEF